jgi:hypothetical protein
MGEWLWREGFRGIALLEGLCHRAIPPVIRRLVIGVSDSSLSG